MVAPRLKCAVPEFKGVTFSWDKTFLDNLPACATVKDAESTVRDVQGAIVEFVKNPRAQQCPMPCKITAYRTR